MVIRQGEVYWVELDESTGSEPGYRHPCIVIQNNLFNASRLNTTMVCVLTSNLKRATSPGNILLNPGEANLPKQSVVNVTQIITINKSQLEEKIGTLTRTRVREILDGLNLLLEPREP